MIWKPYYDRCLYFNLRSHSSIIILSTNWQDLDALQKILGSKYPRVLLIFDGKIRIRAFYFRLPFLKWTNIFLKNMKIFTYLLRRILHVFTIIITRICVFLNKIIHNIVFKFRPEYPALHPKGLFILLYFLRYIILCSISEL